MSTTSSSNVVVRPLFVVWGAGEHIELAPKFIWALGPESACREYAFAYFLDDVDIGRMTPIGSSPYVLRLKCAYANDGDVQTYTIKVKLESSTE